MKALLLLLLCNCTGDLVEPWQLDHDRIVAVRATPPRIPANATATLDILVAQAGAAPIVVAPDATQVVSPASLASAMQGALVTAPSDAALAAARTELALAADAPVPLVVEMTAHGFTATKTVWLGEAADNPPFVDLQIGLDDSLVFPVDTNIPLAVRADDGTDNVTWLTSCGTMHDFDLSRAYLRIEPDDPQAGDLVLVLRDPRGGVSWQMWSVQAAP